MMNMEPASSVQASHVRMQCCRTTHRRSDGVGAQIRQSMQTGASRLASQLCIHWSSLTNRLWQTEPCQRPEHITEGQHCPATRCRSFDFECFRVPSAGTGRKNQEPKRKLHRKKCKMGSASDMNKSPAGGTWVSLHDFL